MLLKYSAVMYDQCYLMVHNKLPVQERLFRINMARDPYCSCSTATVQDICHFFAHCDRTRRYWDWTKKLTYDLLGLRNVSDEFLLGFKWPKSKRDRDICFLISHYVFIIWDMLMRRKLQTVSEREFFGFLRYKYKEALSIKAVQEITGLL